MGEGRGEWEGQEKERKGREEADAEEGNRGLIGANSFCYILSQYIYVCNQIRQDSGDIDWLLGRGGAGGGGGSLFLVPPPRVVVSRGKSGIYSSVGRKAPILNVAATVINARLFYPPKAQSHLLRTFCKMELFCKGRHDSLLAMMNACR